MKNLKVKKDITNKVIQELKNFAKKKLLVGIPEFETKREDDGYITNAMIGYIAEYGSPAQNIPPRPWLMPSMRQSQDAVVEILKKEALKLEPEKGLELAGIKLRSNIQKYINTSSNFEPLAQSTLSARTKQGFKGIKPLIRTGQFRNSVNYVIVDK